MVKKIEHNDLVSAVNGAFPHMMHIFKLNHRLWCQSKNNHLFYSYPKHNINAGRNVHLDRNSI